MNRFHYGNTTDPNLLYLLQYQITDNFFFLEVDGVQYVFLSVLELAAFQEQGSQKAKAVDIAFFGKNNTAEVALAILKKYDVNEVTVPSNFPYGLARELLAKGIDLVESDDWRPERRQKSPEEISAIKDNFEHTKKAFVYIEEVVAEAEIKGDVLLYQENVLTSEYLKREVKQLLLEYDLECRAGLIISSGPQAALPHHEGSGPLRSGETIIVDIFPQSSRNHYFADMTRTYVKGVPMYNEVSNMYEAVAAAQENAMKALRPGVECKLPYEISAGIIERAGFDVGERGYVHSLGHGLGVAVHERPNLSARAEGQLKVGDVVTVEPGLYYPKWGGVRIEDTVVITEDGYQNITNYPQNWLID